jgi:hypothetical protein
MNITDFDPDRLVAIRAGLIDQVSSRRHRRIPVWAAIAAFAIAGAATGGAVSAFASTRTDSSAVSVPQEMFLGLLRGGHVVGPLISREASGSTQLDLGSRPDNATGIVSYMQCDGSGGFVQTLGGEVQLRQQCASNTGMGFSTDTDPTNSAVSVDSEANLNYTIWAQWFTTPAPAQPSAAQQAAVADGVITEAEWHETVDRFAACMNGAGYPLLEIQYTPLSYGTSSDAERTGAIEWCQESELNQVEKIWAVQSQ